MKIRGVVIEDTFAEAFTMRVARIIITGSSMRWVRAAALKLTGFATSVIGCKVEAGIERELSSSGTPDGRPGTSVLLMTMSKDDLGKRLIERIGQTVLTCPTTACYDGLPDAPDRVGVGSALRFFGDGFQGSKVIGGAAVLAHPGHGRRIPGAGKIRHDQRGGRGQFPDPRAQRCGRSRGS